MESAVLIAVAVFAGTIAQYLTGMGFSLVGAPLLVLALGPEQGVALVNLGALLFTVVATFFVSKGVDWRLFRDLAIPCAVGSLAGALLVVAVPAAPLQVAIAGTVIAGLLLALGAARTPWSPPTWARIPAGFASGAMGSAAGVGGPAVAAYAVSARIEHSVFAATLQPYFLVAATFAIGARAVVGAAIIPELDPALWMTAFVAAIAGVALSSALRHRVSKRVARQGMIALALAGAAAALIQGVVEISGHTS